MFKLKNKNVELSVDYQINRFLYFRYVKSLWYKITSRKNFPHINLKKDGGEVDLTLPLFFPKMNHIDRGESTVFLRLLILSQVTTFPHWKLQNSQNFIEVPQVFQKIWRFSLSILTIFTIFFFDILTFSCYKETNDVSIWQMMPALFHFQPTLNRLLNNCIKLYWY